MKTMAKSAKKVFAAAACMSMLLVFFAGCNPLSNGVLTKSFDKQLITFAFEKVNNSEAGLTKDIQGMIDQENHTILVEVPPNIDKMKLKASFTFSDKAKVFIGTTEQKSGETVNDFSNVKDGVKFTVKAENGTTQDYIVKVVFEKRITEFKFEAANNGEAHLTKDVAGIVIQKKYYISVEVPSGTDKTKLKASFNLSNGAKLFQGKNELTSGSSKIDFSNIKEGVKLTVVASDGTTQEYTVKVYLEIKLAEFGFKQANNSALPADVKSHVGSSSYFGRIIVTKLPIGTPESSLATLKPYFIVSEGVTVSVKDVPLTSGVTPVDFSDLLNGVIFKLTAADGGSITYNAGTEIDLPNPPKAEVEEYFGSYYSEFTHPRYGKNKVVIVLEEKKVTLYSTAMSTYEVNVEWEKNADNTYTCTTYSKNKLQIKNLYRLGKYDFIKVGDKIQVKTKVMGSLDITAEKGKDFVWTPESGYKPARPR